MKVSIQILTMFIPLMLIVNSKAKAQHINEDDIVGNYCLCKQENAKGNIIANPFGPIFKFQKGRPSAIQIKHESVPFGWSLRYDVLNIRNESGRASDFKGDFRLVVKPHSKGKELILTDEKRRIKYYLTPSKYAAPPQK